MRTSVAIRQATVGPFDVVPCQREIKGYLVYYYLWK